MSKPILIHAAPELSADLFHHVPLVIVDPFFYLETGDGRKIAMIGALERDRVLGLEMEIEVLDPADYGRYELLKEGMDFDMVELETGLRALRDLGIGEVAVPPQFPLASAEHLRQGGVEVTVDAMEFAARRRVKTGRELDGIRRAQKAADAAMAEAARLIRDADGTLTAEEVRAAMTVVCRDHGCELPDDVIVAPNEQGALGHEPGHGPIRRGDSVIVDIWPRDKASRCWADMTRTFVAGGGGGTDEIARYHALTQAALDAVMPAIRPGASGRAIYDLACEVYEAAGEPTQRQKPADGPPIEDGFFHGLGHGVGLEVHERPGLGLSGEELIAGDVITVEPGCYRQGFGGVRLEDLVLVTENGAEILTDFPYGLT